MMKLGILSIHLGEEAKISLDRELFLEAAGIYVTDAYIGMLRAWWPTREFQTRLELRVPQRVVWQTSHGGIAIAIASWDPSVTVEDQQRMWRENALACLKALEDWTDSLMARTDLFTHLAGRDVPLGGVEALQAAMEGKKQC